jgi:hypothetical protein
LAFWYTLKSVLTGFGLFSRVPGYLIQWRFKRGSAKKQFRRELISAGLSKQEAQELANLYPFKMDDFVALARRPSTSFQ